MPKDSTRVPEATIYRLSLYHCWLGEYVRTEPLGRVTSGQLAAELGVKEETLRRDLSYVGAGGRPGSGYDAASLLAAIQGFLGIEDRYAIIRIGSAQMLEALSVVFPPEAYGVVPVAYYSELAEDVGRDVHGLTVRHLSELPATVPDNVDVAVVACSPEQVQHAIDLLDAAGITGVLLLTPQLKLDKPERMNIVHVRMPCDVKALACRCAVPGRVTSNDLGVLPPIGGVESR